MTTKTPSPRKSGAGDNAGKKAQTKEQRETAEWRAEQRRELEAAQKAAHDAWEERDKFDPDSWFRIPLEPDVKPADVDDFHGFEGPVIYYWNPEVAKPIRELLRTARTLLKRSGVLSMWDMHARLDEALDIFDKHTDEEGVKGFEHLSEQQRAAVLYFHSMNYLRSFTARRNGSNHDDVLNLANAAEWIVSWAMEGTEEALSRAMVDDALKMRMSKNGAKGGKRSAQEREVKVAPAKVLEEARRRGWPEKDWGIRSVLATKFGCTPQRIGQILKSAAVDFESRK